MEYLTYDEKIKLLGLTFDSMQSLYSDKSYYIVPTKTGKIIMNLIYKNAEIKHENPVYILSCLFEYWIFINRNHKTKDMKVLSPSAVTTELINKAYQANYDFDKKYQYDIHSIFNRDNLLVQGASSYFQGKDRGRYKNDLLDWGNRLIDEFLNTQEGEPNKEVCRQGLISKSKGNFRVAEILNDGLDVQPAVISILDYDIYKLYNKRLLTRKGFYQYLQDHKYVLLDKYLKEWYSYLDERGRLLKYGKQ